MASSVVQCLAKVKQGDKSQGHLQCLEKKELKSLQLSANCNMTDDFV